MLLMWSWLGSASVQADALEHWAGIGRPTLVLDRLDGPRMDLAEQRGGVVIVHFFATWCAPCIGELASLDALAMLPGTNVTILAVDVGEIDARLRNFLREHPVAFPVLLDRDRAAMKAWQVQSLPTSFVLDRDLKPALKAEGPLDWTSPPIVRSLAALSRQASGMPERTGPIQNR